MNEQKNSMTEAAILAYLQILQSTISRMGMNSLYCKILCGTLLAALGTIGSLSGCTFFLSSVFPLLVCAWADARYLSLERVYREKYNKTVEKYYRASDAENVPELFDMNPGKEYFDRYNQKRSVLSWSIWCVYLVLLMYMVIIAFIK